MISFRENNSGGSWWLTREHYAQLAAIGWTIGSNGTGHSAYRFGVPLETAIDEWRAITGYSGDEDGCECCGPPFSFIEEEDATGDALY